MDFDLSEDQKMLTRTVAEFCKTESTVERFRKLRDADGASWDRKTWKQMGELGWLGVPFPEELGGFGGSFVDAALILQELGKTLVPEPYLASLVLGGYTVMLGGSEEQQQRILGPMISGDTSLALAWAERSHRFNASEATTTATKAGDNWQLKGEKIFVLNGADADQLIVSAQTPDGLGLFVVAADTTGLERKTIGLIDGQRAARIGLDVTVAAEDRLESGSAAVLQRVMDYGAAASVAEGVGVASSMLAMTVEYLKTRKQFNAPIGSFQALQHRAVDMFVEMELLRSIAIEAMVRADEPGDENRIPAICAAKHQLSNGATFISRQSIQLHGGIGVTDEHDIGLFFKRLHALTTICGDEAHHLARIQ